MRTKGNDGSLRKLASLLMLTFLALNAVSCQQDIILTYVPTVEALPDQLVTLPSPIEESGDDSWRRLDTTGGGEQTAIAPHPSDPDIVYMASDNGGLFKTENGGDTWSSVSSNLGAYRLGFVALDPLDPQVVYVTASTDHGGFTTGGATGEIHRSLNGGLVWEIVSDAMGFQSSNPSQASIVIPYDPAHSGRFDRDGDRLSDLIVVGAWTGPADPPVGGIWRSEDEGRTFAHLALEDKNVTALRAFAGDVHVLFAATYEGRVYRSEDLGESWTDVTGDLPLAHRSDLAVHPVDRNVLYVTTRLIETGEPPVWKTTDGGQNWRAASAGLDPSETLGFPRILMDRFDPDTLYVTTKRAPSAIGGVYQSRDGGSSWHLMPARLVLPDGRPYNWYRFSGKLAIGQAIDGRLFAGDGGAWRYPDGDPADGREEWEPATIGIGNVRVNDIEVDPLDPTVLYQGIGDRGPYKSVDRGSTFHRILGTGWPVMVDNYVWNGPYYSNYRRCWLPCSPTCTERWRIASGDTTDFAVSRQNPDVLYSTFVAGADEMRRGGVNKSTDGGKTWQPVGFQLEEGFELAPEACVPYGFSYLAIDPTNDHIVFAAMEIPAAGEAKLYWTGDGGATWLEVYSGSSYIKGIAVSALNPDLVAFVTGSDVYKSEQGGEAGSWQVITPPDAEGIRTIGLSPHDEQVYVIGTNDLGIYHTVDGGASWSNRWLEGLFEQRSSQGSDQYLDAEIATAFNPRAYLLKNVSAIVFDPLASDTFYIGGTQHTRASFGVAKVTDAGLKWERLPLEGLSHRNISDLATDSLGEFLYAGTHNGTYRLRLRPGS